ncbi:MAG: TonB-dependent receptor [Pseudomonadota bacterium]
MPAIIDRSKLQIALVTGVAVAGSAIVTAPALAQTADEEARQQVVVVTGTRIQQPGVVSSSPITTIGQEEIEFQQVADVEKLLRNLPITVPGDGQNVNNGTEGAATVDLRNLGPERNLILVDGKRLVPFNENGEVDVSVVPLAMLERIDIVTGGASAVYGSDAIAGAVNFILKSDFQGVELDADYQVTSENDGEIVTASLVLGTNLDEGRGNVTLGLNFTEREAVLLADREFGLFGIDTASGDGLGASPTASPDRCANDGTTAAVGSTTSIPARLDLVSGQRQFNNDGTLGDPCNRFNFNPFNYFQTPQERFSGLANGFYEITPDVEAYGRFLYATTNVDQQVAPSGLFGNTFTIPLQNPFISDAARQTILDDTNGFIAANPDLTLGDLGVVDNNGNGVFDLGDSITTGVRRRTIEFGTRLEQFDSNIFQTLIGFRGDIMGWDWDLSYAHGESDRTRTRSGYTNVDNIAISLNTVDANQCITPAGVLTPGCVPLNPFGPIGSITPDTVQFNTAVALLHEETTQDILSASISGPWEALKSPAAANPTALAFGMEYREEGAVLTPDDCLRVQPSSCQGGAGGFIAPITGTYDVYEVFGEAITPLVEDRPGFENLSLELGYRYSDYSSIGGGETWKAGLNWQVTDAFRFRVMQQKAVRAPTVAELFSPVVTGLEDAQLDPCSVANAANITPELAARCISTGMNPALVGVVQDIVSGQINTFEGTNPAAPPAEEEADTTTLGFVWQPGFLGGPIQTPTITLDYYNIEIDNVIGEFSPQEVLDNCYILDAQDFCSLIVRVNGTLANPAAGVQVFTTNLVSQQAEGIELGFRGGLDLGNGGELTASLNANYYLTNESQSTSFADAVDCLGKFGNDCSPTPELSFIQRTTWAYGPLELSYLWRNIGEVSIQESQRAGTFPAFQEIEAQNYFDLAGSYQINDVLRFTASITNLLDEDPPLVGNEAGSTAFNSGNTFPSTYDTLGRIYAIGVNAKF